VVRNNIEASVGSTIRLDCRSPNATLVVHAEWDFHQLNVGKPILIYDGDIVNPKLAHYDVLCNLSSAICDLQISRLQADDAGEYQCYLSTNDIGTLMFLYRLTVIGRPYVLKQK